MVFANTFPMTITFGTVWSGSQQGGHRIREAFTVACRSYHDVLNKATQLASNFEQLVAYSAYESAHYHNVYSKNNIFTH